LLLDIPNILIGILIKKSNRCFEKIRNCKTKPGAA
jgi:hypothetical protein